MGSREFEMVAESFASVFPNTSLWWGKLDSKRALIALVGTIEPSLLGRVEELIDAVTAHGTR